MNQSIKKKKGKPSGFVNWWCRQNMLLTKKYASEYKLRLVPFEKLLLSLYCWKQHNCQRSLSSLYTRESGCRGNERKWEREEERHREGERERERERETDRINIDWSSSGSFLSHQTFSKFEYRRARLHSFSRRIDHSYSVTMKKAHCYSDKQTLIFI